MWAIPICNVFTCIFMFKIPSCHINNINLNTIIYLGNIQISSSRLDTRGRSNKVKIVEDSFGEEERKRDSSLGICQLWFYDLWPVLSELKISRGYRGLEGRSYTLPKNCQHHEWMSIQHAWQFLKACQLWRWEAADRGSRRCELAPKSGH